MKNNMRFSVQIKQNEMTFSVIPVSMQIRKTKQRIFAKRVTLLTHYVKIVHNNTLGRNEAEIMNCVKILKCYLISQSKFLFSR